ncbi:hypothetical protein EKO04_007514 [Ascochyta lentis]|uniref:RTA1 like protein n=1 Tax=Ascochyta lentis TaxID=205686 RepID=A0A8H7IYL0_9PLEO|nr:hypothetical protein EKO04_007514 [Ascochyta lentis]
MANNEVSLYPYTPSKTAAVISAVVFALLLAIHTFKLFKTKTWFAIPFVIGAIFETLGYLARAYSCSHLSEVNPYIAQTLFILLAPILFAASIYMFLGRIIRATGYARSSIIRPTLVTKIFLGGDILCFLVQAAGAGMLAKTDASQSTKDTGKIVILAGLIIQLFVFGFFVVVAAIFHFRARKVEGSKGLMQEFDWQRYLFMLYAVSGLITVRNVFRVAEYAMGEDGYLLAHEWPIYIFDALLMAVSLVICTTWYVGNIVSKASQGDREDIYVMMAGQETNGARV